ncbi:hypothetical protein ACJ41O_012722 [Fusarium nematophilum]
MGQEYSSAKPDTTLRVIGAGLPRTGTASLAVALEILLDGPVIHGGTQAALAPEEEIKTWIKILSQSPPTNDSMRRNNRDLIQSRTEGFVGITDCPGMLFVHELMELYPGAKVICTVRDVAAWERSMSKVSNKLTQGFLRFILFPLPSMRFLVDYINALRGQWYLMYGETEPLTKKTYEYHIEWLKENVPRDRLVFFDVREGWEPLCQALGLPVPEDVPFPRINDGEAIEEFMKKQVTRGLIWWVTILAVGAWVLWVILG